MKRLTIPAAALALAACAQKSQPAPDSSPPAGGVMCTMEARPAIQMTVLDQQGAPLAAGTAVRVIANLDALDARRPPARPATPYADTVSMTAAGDSTSVGLAHERAGVFTVTVTAPGFRTFTLFDYSVEKTPDGCHVATRRYTARLPR